MTLHRTGLVTGNFGSPLARSRRSDRSSAIAFYMLLAPLLAGLALFIFTPIVWGLLLSVSRARNTLSPGDFVGLENYRAILGDPEFLRSLVVVAVYAAFIVPVTWACSLGLALLVHGLGFGRAFFRTVFFIPAAVSYVVASLIWRMSLFNGMRFGFANMVLGWLGAEPIVWIGTADPPWFWIVLVSVRLWLQVGFYMIIFLAALQEIPVQLYEAAAVDGAGPGWRTFRHITFPMLRNASIAVVLLNLIAAFQAFDEFYNILGGGLQSLGNRTLARPPLVYLYSVALNDQNYGQGSAGAFVLTALILIATLIQARIVGWGRSTS